MSKIYLDRRPNTHTSSNLFAYNNNTADTRKEYERYDDDMKGQGLGEDLAKSALGITKTEAQAQTVQDIKSKQPFGKILGDIGKTLLNTDIIPGVQGINVNTLVQGGEKALGAL